MHSTGELCFKKKCCILLWSIASHDKHTTRFKRFKCSTWHVLLNGKKSFNDFFEKWRTSNSVVVYLLTQSTEKKRNKSILFFCLSLILHLVTLRTDVIKCQIRKVKVTHCPFFALNQALFLQKWFHNEKRHLPSHPAVISEQEFTA